MKVKPQSHEGERPRFVIINTTDRPEPRMVCELVNGKYYYMARQYDDRLRDYAMDGAQATSLEDFGFAITEQEYQTDFVLSGPSVAKYEDGKTREWQSTTTEFSMPNVYLGDTTHADR